MKNSTRTSAALALVSLVALASCTDTEQRPLANAQRITSNTQLVGGPAARGEIGDYLLENDQIRVVIQDKTYNRGSGLFGGSLIDADLKRAGDNAGILGGNGRDSFGELFPAFFLEVIEPEEIEVVADGADGGAAIVEVRGRGGEFVTLLRVVNQVMVNSYAADANIQRGIAGLPPLLDQDPQVRFTVRYILEPGARHVRIESSIINDSFNRLEFPNTAITALLSQFLNGLSFDGFTVPAGHVVGLGKLNTPFLPGIGYNLQFGLLDAYAENDVPLPALPGHLTPMIGTSSRDGVSYGFAMDAPANPDTSALEKALAEHFVYAKDQQTPEGSDETFYGGRAKIDDMLFLFYASGFGGVFTHQLPPELGPSFCAGEEDSQATCEALFPDDPNRVDQCLIEWGGCKELEAAGTPSSFTYTNYLIVGSGDVSSVWDELYTIKGQPTRRVAGRILDSQSGAPVGSNINLIVYKAIEGAGDARCTPGDSSANSPVIWNQVFTQGGGFFDFTLAPGEYCYRTVSGSRPLSDYVPFTVAADQDLYIEPIAQASGRIEVWSTGTTGEPLPSKITLVGTHEHRPGVEKREYLYNLDASEPWRTSDMVPDTDDPTTRRYIERIEYIGASGQASISARPGTYEVWVSRGPEYEAFVQEVTIAAGEQARVQALLERSVDTTGWMSADFHVHARGSIDSGLNYRDRIMSVAAEGLEIAISTDHNYVSDFTPYIVAGNYEDWVNSLIGLELTTFEAGHFNAFPLAYDIEAANRGSFEWQDRPPGLIFEELRNRGTLGPADTIIQVNHPRDTILGYFSQHNVDPLTSDVDLPFNVAEGNDRLFAAIASPNGDAFYTQTGPRTYESTFSWNFDAIEIFNGKRIELLESFRASRATLEPLYVAHYTAELLDEADVDYDPAACTSARDAVADCAPDACTSERDTVADCETKEAMVATDAAAAAAAQLDRVAVDGEVVVCEDGAVAFPGHLDDWYTMLNYARPYGLRDYEADAISDPARVEELNSSLYKRYTATGNSDSHGARGGDEVGTPRNWIYVGHDDPAQMTAREVVTAVKEHRVIVSNGPFVDFSIDGQPMGSEVDASSGTATMSIRVAAAEWVAPNRYEVIQNGEVITSGEVVLEGGEFTTTVELTPERDSWYIVRVTGEKNLFPIISPSEIPPFDLNAAIGGLAEPFGFGSPPAGLAPELTFPLSAYAFTNPIWVVADGDGTFDPPAPPVQTCDGVIYDPNNLASFDEFTRELGTRRTDAIDLPFHIHHHSKVARLKGEKHDVRLLFESWSGCRH